MRALALLILVVAAIVAVTASSSRGDGDLTTSATTTPTPEPTVGPPVEPLPSKHVPQHEPFTPYEVTPGAGWSYEQLTPDEKAIADRGLDEDQTQIQDAYAAASAALAATATADRAALQLGVDGALDEIGVVP